MRHQHYNDIGAIVNEVGTLTKGVGASAPLTQKQQIERLRQERFKQLLPAWLIYNPSTRQIMLSRFIAEHVKRRRKNKKIHPHANAFINTLLKNIALKQAKRHHIPFDKVVALAKQKDITLLEALHELLHENSPYHFSNIVNNVAATSGTMRVAGKTVTIPEIGGIVNNLAATSGSYHSADADAADDDVLNEVQVAKAEISKLPKEAQADASTELNSIETAVNDNVDVATKAVKSADKSDVSALKQIQPTDLVKAAASTTSTTVNPVPLKTVAEKKALGEVTQPTWVKPVVITAGIAIIAYAGYKLFYKKHKK